MTAADAFPGWPRVEAYLLECMADGDDAKLPAVDVMVVLGERARLMERLEQAARVMRRVQAGDGCWGSEQGYAPCEFRGVERLLKAAPKKRWRPWPFRAGAGIGSRMP